MPRYLSPEWVQAFNNALAELDLTPAISAAASGSLTVSGGTFAVAQVVTDAPPDTGASAGMLRTVLSVVDGQITLSVDATDTPSCDVTMVLTYDDALSIARGVLDPADALATGRVRVRGELAVLVAGQGILNAASAALGHTLTDLTDVSDTPQALN